MTIFLQSIFQSLTILSNNKLHLFKHIFGYISIRFFQLKLAKTANTCNSGAKLFTILSIGVKTFISEQRSKIFRINFFESSLSQKPQYNSPASAKKLLKYPEYQNPFSRVVSSTQDCVHPKKIAPDLHSTPRQLSMNQA